MSNNNFLEEIFEVVEERKENPIEGSYTNYLLEQGIDKILKKVGEESAEVIIAAKNNSKEEVVYEISDLLYHLTVLMVKEGISIDEVATEMEKRRSKICNKKPEKNLDSIH